MKEYLIPALAVGVLSALRQRGFEAEYGVLDSPTDAPVPSILHVRVKNIPHVVVVLEKDDEQITIGDPLEGKDTLTYDDFQARYKPDPFCTTIHRLPTRP